MIQNFLCNRIELYKGEGSMLSLFTKTKMVKYLHCDILVDFEHLWESESSMIVIRNLKLFYKWKESLLQNRQSRIGISITQISLVHQAIQKVRHKRCRYYWCYYHSNIINRQRSIFVVILTHLYR